MRRADGTTAAERFYGAAPRDCFAWLLDRLAVPARPVQAAMPLDAAARQGLPDPRGPDGDTLLASLGTSWGASSSPTVPLPSLTLAAGILQCYDQGPEDLLGSFLPSLQSLRSLRFNELSG